MNTFVFMLAILCAVTSAVQAKTNLAPNGADPMSIAIIETLDSPAVKLFTKVGSPRLQEAMICSASDKIQHSGCCSHHSGVCGCSSGHAECCDGTQSPSCGCD